MEQIKSFRILHEELSPETGVMTPTRKKRRKQLMEQAKHAEEARDHALAKYHHFEISSAAFQIGIVLASATIITGMMVLVWLSGGIGIVGLIFMGIGLFAPEAVHLM